MLARAARFAPLTARSGALTPTIGALAPAVGRLPSELCGPCSSQGLATTADSPCFRCGEMGHWARECPTLPNKAAKKDTCNRCGKPGHWARQCKEPRNDYSSSECNRCGRIGHWAKDCDQPDMRKEKEQEA